MAQTKTYLTVPYAQKDEAKALGARWDAGQKKWYVPADKDIALFGKWPVIASDKLAAPTNQAPSKNTANQPPETANPVKQGFITYPSIDNFSAYNGDEPPWA